MNKMCLRLCDNRSKSYYEGNGIEKETEVQLGLRLIRRRHAFIAGANHIPLRRLLQEKGWHAIQ